MTSDEEATPIKALLFTLRVWSVNEEARASTMRARLQNTHTGEVHFVSDPKALIVLLEEALSDHSLTRE